VYGLSATIDPLKLETCIARSMPRMSISMMNVHTSG
jgi:hypothetical protein